MDNLLKEIEKYAEVENVPIMQKKGINFLCKLIEDNNYKNILEVGTAIGYSSIKMALVSDDIKVTTIEKDEERYMVAVKNVNNAKLDKRINLIYADALNVELDGKYDLIFIDAAKGQYINFFNKYKENLNEGGTIISDNMSFHGFVETEERIKSRNLRGLVNRIKRYINFLETNTEFETKFYKVGDGIAVSTKKEC